MSIAKIAEIAGVSNTTVSFVINGKPGISPDTVKRVRAAIRETGYIPKATANTRKNAAEALLSTTGNIGILMPDGVMSTIPFYARLFEAIHKELDIRGLNMSPIRCGDPGDLSKSSFADLDGLILCNYIKDITDLIDSPFVSVLGHPSVEDKLNADHIEPANDRIGVVAARYLIERGHKNLLAINPSVTHHPAMETRIQYFTDFAHRRGVETRSINIGFIERDRYDRLIDGSTVENIRNFVSTFKNEKNTATGIFVPCDSHMVILLKSFAAAGIIPGVDVEFIGCNNESILLDGISPRPATIDINPNAMARAAIVALLQRVEHPGSYDNIYKVVDIEPTLLKAGDGIRNEW
jgi:DNA-binding LacI/PurR family transcriptional regulator